MYERDEEGVIDEIWYPDFQPTAEQIHELVIGTAKRMREIMWQATRHVPPRMRALIRARIVNAMFDHLKAEF